MIRSFPFVNMTAREERYYFYLQIMITKVPSVCDYERIIYRA